MLFIAIGVTLLVLLLVTEIVGIEIDVPWMVWLCLTPVLAVAVFCVVFPIVGMWLDIAGIWPDFITSE